MGELKNHPRIPDSQTIPWRFLRVLGGCSSPLPPHLCGTFLRFGHLLGGPVVVETGRHDGFGLGGWSKVLGPQTVDVFWWLKEKGAKKNQMMEDSGGRLKHNQDLGWKPKANNQFIGGTVDGWNPAPVDMVNIPLFTGFYTSQLVQDFLHQQYHCIWKKPLITN